MLSGIGGEEACSTEDAMADDTSHGPAEPVAVNSAGAAAVQDRGSDGGSAPTLLQSPVCNFNCSVAYRRMEHCRTRTQRARADAFWQALKQDIDSSAKQEQAAKAKPPVLKMGSVGKLMNAVAAAKVRSQAQSQQLSDSLSDSKNDSKSAQVKSGRWAALALAAAKKFAIDPSDPRKLVWDNIIGCAVVYRVLVVPWRVAFATPSTGACFAWEAAIAALCAADVAARFATGRRDGDTDILVVDHKDIARRYVQGWLVLDLLAAVPLDTLLRPAIGYPSYVVLVALRGLRLLQLMRLNRARVGPFEIGPVPLSIVKTVLIVVLAAHLLSCLSFYVACYDSVYEVGGPEDWLRCGHNGSQFSHYLASYYFITYTMTTVGYGDIHAVGKKEVRPLLCCELNLKLVNTAFLTS
eukprot:TRINITY_DN23193_c0_g1_i1.p1 TRINITY_DN23193_c0_g1~~TRINITY_DN23193_c0_g1_i1.p1  ORF type:complete len:409 (-),score=94.10 TRINITY_DN23193_c0_g1_i1:701-1927(-)